MGTVKRVTAGSVGGAKADGGVEFQGTNFTTAAVLGFFDSAHGGVY